MDKYKEIKEKVKNISPSVSILDREGWLLYKLARQNNTGPAVEIGSWLGRSTIWLAQGCIDKLKEEGKSYLVYAVDPHGGTSTHEYEGVKDTYQEFLRNLKNAEVDEIVRPIKLTSRQALKEVIWNQKVGSNIGLLFLDGEHKYEAVKEDFGLWSEALALGGVVVLHDTIAYKGPRKLVGEIAISNKYKFTGVCGQLVAFKKIKESYWIWGPNYWWLLYWSFYSLLFMSAKMLPKGIKERIK